MSTYMHIDVTDTTATKETEIQFNRSKLPVSDEVRAIDRELEADPSNCELWMRRGIALSKQMLFKEAVESYSKGLSFNPFHALTYRFRHRNIRYPGQNVVKIGQNIIIRFAVMVIQYLHAGVCHRHVGVQTAEIFFFPHQVMLGTF